jgi:FkbM family methyltransferase
VGNVQFNISALHAKLEPIQHQLEDGHRKLEALHAKLALVETRLGLLEVMYSRLDDLSMKVRMPLAINEATFAVRVADGYASVPRADTMLLITLMDASIGSLEAGTRNVLLRLLEPGMTVVDVGANIGLHTLAAARRVKPNGRIYAFEPAPTTFESLRQTIMMNGIGDVADARMLAVGARAERRTLYLHPISGHNSMYPTKGDEERRLGSIEVDVDTLDALIPPDRGIDLVKIDVEGAELDVLAGMARIIADNRDIAIVAKFRPSCFERAGVTAEQWFREFQKFGLAPYAIKELSGECRPVGHTDIADMASVNVVFAKPSQARRLG